MTPEMFRTPLHELALSIKVRPNNMSLYKMATLILSL